MPNLPKKLKLQDLVGVAITVENVAHEQGTAGSFQFSMHGKLEAPVDGDPNYHLRVKECYEGTSGMSFHEKHVLEIDRQPSGRYVVMLR